MPLLIILLSFVLLSDEAKAVENAVSITEKECKRLIRIHSVSGADYVPGVGARGNKVVGADLHGGNPINIPDEITFNMKIDLAEKYGFAKDGVISASGNIGRIKVKGKKVYWNDQRLNPDDTEEIVEACRAQYGN